jgi:hypothetical protein
LYLQYEVKDNEDPKEGYVILAPDATIAVSSLVALNSVIHFTQEKATKTERKTIRL